MAMAFEACERARPFPLEHIAGSADVGRRKTRIVLTLLKHAGAVREHRDGAWERLRDQLPHTDLEGALLDYEERRRRDREKLELMEAYCRTAQCRTRVLLDYFGDDPGEEYRCGHCDNDLDPPKVAS